MARTRSLASLVVLAGVLVLPSRAAAQGDGEDGRLNYLFQFQIGSRSLDDDAWEGIDDHLLIGFEGAYLPRGAGGFGIEYGVSFSGDDTEELGVDVTATLVEGSVGVCYVFGHGPIYPLVGAGLSAIYADVEGEQGGFSTSDDDTTFGGYAHAGLFWRAPGGFSIGVDGRLATTSDLEIFGIDTDADYTQVALTLGWCR